MLDILSKVGMNPHHRQQLEQRLREQQKYHPGSVDQHPIQNNSQNFQSAKTKHKTSSSSPETEEDAVQPPRPSRQTPQYASVRKQITPSPPPPALPQKGRRSANSQQAHPPEQPPKLPEKKHKLPPPKPSVMQNHQSSVNHNRYVCTLQKIKQCCAISRNFYYLGDINLKIMKMMSKMKMLTGIM